MDSSHLGKLLVVVGGILVLMGGLTFLAGKVPWLGRLPGDISVKREGFEFHFPIVTCLLLSVVLTLIFWFLGRGK